MILGLTPAINDTTLFCQVALHKHQDWGCVPGFIWGGGSWVSVAMAGCIAGHSYVTNTPDLSGLPWVETYHIYPYISMFVCLGPEGKWHRIPCLSSPDSTDANLFPAAFALYHCYNKPEPLVPHAFNEWIPKCNEQWNEMGFISDPWTVCLPVQKEWVRMATHLLQTVRRTLAKRDSSQANI